MKLLLLCSLLVSIQAEDLPSPMDGFKITSNHETGESNTIIIDRTYGASTDGTLTELLDASCQNPINMVLNKTDTEVMDGDRPSEVISTITVNPFEIEASLAQGIIFDEESDLTPSTNPSAIKGTIKFCLQSTSLLDLSGSNLAMQSLKLLYSINYDGTNKGFQLGTDIVESSPDDSGSNFGDVLTSFEIEAIRCSAGGTDVISDTSIIEGQTLYLCIKPDQAGGVLSDINLTSFYNDNSLLLLLASKPALTVVQLDTVGDWTRIAVPVLSEFVEGDGNQMLLSGTANVGFTQGRTEQRDDEDLSSFEFFINLEPTEEVGCIGKLSHAIQELFL